jgi:Flp pilus assembly protein TadG
MTRSPSPQSRRGTTTVESAIVLSTLLLLLFALFDLGLAAFRYNTLAAVTRRIAREAIVRGDAAPPDRSAWGPGAYVGTAADASEIASIASPLLVTMTNSDVAIQMSWPDGDNAEGDRVQVRLTYVHHPFVPFLSIGSFLNLQAETTMRLVH